MKSYDKLVARLSVWVKIFEAIQILKPGGLYKITHTQTGDWDIAVPQKYTISAFSYKSLASNIYIGNKAWALAAMPQLKIEVLKPEDLPRYIGSPWVGPEFEKYLKKGK